MSGIDYILQVTLISFRISGFLLAVPLFAYISIPGPVKFVFAFSLAFALASFTPSISKEILSNNISLFIVIAREIGLGLFMGFSVKLMFMLMSLTLEYAGLQMGFSIASLFDPQNNTQVSMVAALGINMLLVYFLVMNFHHDLFYALVKSYQIVPISLPDWKMNHLFSNLSESLKVVYLTAFRLAMPVVFSILMIHVVVAIISRTAPQMNLFFNITFIVNVVVGLVLINLSWPNIFGHVHQFAKNLFARGYLLW